MEKARVSSLDQCRMLPNHRREHHSRLARVGLQTMAILEVFAPPYYLQGILAMLASNSKHLQRLSSSRLDLTGQGNGRKVF